MSRFGRTRSQKIRHCGQASELLKKQPCLLLAGCIPYQMVKTVQNGPFKNVNFKYILNIFKNIKTRRSSIARIAMLRIARRA